ncbi:hypothetical protein F5884DRAFT_864219 [Xylogone sp. PMI_703]|nr:hypothetical protein F5884DRAFT_864219 [Xylogone sp. PMI_703]
MAAAKVMLDERHPDLPTKPNDDNIYILGRVCAHNVVIACLPSGVYGTTSAATVAARLLTTFESIRFGLMVGIGGGVPSKSADIRLGDIVVSKPTRDFGGVVQYDFGKTIEHGLFERTGILNLPPQILLTAVARLQATISMYPMMRAKFTYCGQEQDRLFESTYDHSKSEDTCDACDAGRLVTRSPRVGYDPVIHYGLIASGNQVMKHGYTRDKLAQELGILCFEMEAAGLMNNFPCLVIRGICDYADSHKNKQWQEYAAATAAAYAKELLCVIPTNQIGETLEAVSVTSPGLLCNSDKHPLAVQSSTAWAVQQSYGQNDEELLNKISSYDHERVHRRLCRKRLIGTTQWFLDHPDFKAWFIEKRLPIGSGKTIIATSVVEAAKHRNPEVRAPTVFFYCENEQHGTQQGSYVLSSFIKQLCDFLRLMSRPWPEDIIREIRRFFGPKRIEPDFEDLKDIFISLFHYIPDTIYILDGLDALDREHGEGLLRVFQSLFCNSRSTQGSRILLLSRDQIPGYIDVAIAMPGICQISTLSNVLRDIETYIETSIVDKSLFHRLTDDPQLLEEIKRVLLIESSGMYDTNSTTLRGFHSLRCALTIQYRFLWVYLQLEILWATCVTDAEIRSALSKLPKGLEETYFRCAERIDLQDSRTLKVLKWVSYATRPLHIEELREAIAFDLQDSEWDSKKFPQTDFVIGCCANLVVVDPTDNCIRFAHSSVKQFLEKDPQNCIPRYPISTVQGELECGEFCIAYLSFSNFSLQLKKQADETAVVAVLSLALLAGEARESWLGRRFLRGPGNQKRSLSLPFRRIRTDSTPALTQYKFLDYAITNWALQTKQISRKSLVWEKFEKKPQEPFCREVNNNKRCNPL